MFASLRALFLLGIVFVPLAAARGDGFQVSGKGFIYRHGKTYVRCDAGRWQAGIEGGKSIAWNLFYWHGKWIYESQSGGPITEPPQIAADGSLRFAGRFVARQNTTPLKYTCRATAEDGRVRIRNELEKTGPLTLTDGVLLHVSAGRDQFRGDERIWLPPAWNGTLGSHAKAAADAFCVELAPGQAVRLAHPGFRETDTELTGQSFTYRVRLLDHDFPVGEKQTVEYAVSFDSMPEVFPGEIRPARGRLAIRKAVADRAVVPQFERLDLAVDLDARYENPFDPDEVRLDAVFTSPGGKKLTVPGFFQVAYCRSVREGYESLVPEGNGQWRVRFTPTELGLYRYQLRLRDRSGETTGGEGTFECSPGKSAGFVRASKADPHYLAFDNGQGYFAIGHNLPTYHLKGQTGLDAMEKYAAAKENFNRWWMSSSSLGLEWADKLGWYRQEAAARLDLLLDAAARLGLYYMLCMDTHQDFRERGWERNPFNARNGGPCQTPAEWFTHPKAREYYRKRLRYTAARWGYSPHVLCWEFGNEFEGWDKSPDEIKLPWHREMSDYLRSIDPFGHLITTSFWSNVGPAAFWELPNIDVVQTHLYTNDDGNVAEPIRRYCLHQWKSFAKPHIFGEFGIRSHDTTADKDPQGWAIHNALWAGLVSFSAGGPMPWWHESYLDKLNLYFHFTALANFTAGLPLGKVGAVPLDMELRYQDKSLPLQVRDAVVRPMGTWGRPEHNEFRVLPDGSIADDRQPLRLLHGGGHRDLRNPPTFVVRYPQPGKFIVRVGRVSNSGQLKVWVDDRLILDQPLPCGEGLGKSSQYQPRWKLWETDYDQDYSVDVPAGEHRIRVDNEGKDWVSIGSYTFTRCRVLDRPNVLAAGIRIGEQAILWLQNRESDWANHGDGKVPAVPGFSVDVQGLTDGQYSVQWWETWTGRAAETERVESRGGRLTLKRPELKTDVAAKISREPAPGK